MKKISKNTIIITALVALLPFVSCKKWLDVQPEDKFTEKQIFSTRQGIADALNGIYLEMGKERLYGANLTSTVLDIFAQRYNVNSLHDFSKYQTYTFDDKNVKARLDGMWTQTYINVVNANKFIQNLDAYPGVLDKQTDSLFRGEAYALRAFLQFDMLRLFGPVYRTADSTKTAIPYYTTAGTDVSEILPANQIMQKVIADLNTAEILLNGDPIKKVGVIKSANYNYLTYRNYRLNYYAVKGLQARVYLYRGDKVSALAAAKSVIDNATKFPWITTGQVLSDKINPNRVFTGEILFGLQTLDLYDVHRDYFAPDLQDKSILAPSDARLKTTFENNENDYRYNPNWMLTGIGGKSYKTFFKYADIIDKKLDYRLTISLLRLSEMYYIAAESEQNAGYLNTVRNNRGLLNLPPTANLTTELLKEYQKEFFGEGQLFYYYKRMNSATIPNPLATSGSITMNATKYVVPLPLSELTPR
ncbi:RagB/SusD family nutrient uptake outer membrane protein [Pedobacter psychroterrae]|uniref:RagB/SusD family nutrient uptake outer membrane protein n=1 Tax=Pedobacter psychroterrae TaxID=2530453 RepID=A0A4R0NQX9_9SPHI|nr:RagB/SusD family nutrient uptake outer membrane protein [Pedobacter psychroterrae]TCD03512.1 RagB/SusD family nutrient uptake outer membrane protein [Pedobacter psychroterrae]